MPDKKLKLAGTGTEIENYKNDASENVTFLGFLNRDQITDQLAGSKAIIVPSQWYETFGMIIAEAYACHKPVIAGDIGNIGILVEDGITGKKFKYNSAGDLLRVLGSIDAAMGENGYQKFLREFSPRVNYKQLLDVYEAIK